MGFANGVRPPIDHRHQDHRETGQADELAVGIVMQPHHGAAEQRKRGEGANQRPGVGRKDVIVVILRRGHGWFP